MSRSRMGFLFARAGAVLAMCLAGLLAMSGVLPGVAEAAATPTPTPSATPSPVASVPVASSRVAGPQIVRPLLSAAAPTVKSVKADYSCDFSAYGTGIPAVTVSVTAEVATPWPVNQPDDIALANDAITLPSAVTSQLTGVDSIVVSSTVMAKHATKSALVLAGITSVDATNAPTQIPAIATLGQVTFAAKGSDGSVALPAQSITFTPKAGTSAKPVITCTTSTAAQDVAITVGDASGPFYHCITTIGSASPSDSAGLASLAITESGTKKTTGDSLTISIASSDIATLITTSQSVVAAAGATLDKAAFSADLAVTGAQSGTVHVTKTITDLSATSFSASGTLKLTKAGTVKVHIPSKFGLALSASGTVVIDIQCTLVTKPAPVALTETVSQGPTSTPSATPTATSTGDSGDTEDTAAAPAGDGTPAGGAATGGGAAPGGDMPLLIGGAALALTGGGLLLARATVPRRRKPRPGSQA